MHFFSSSTVLSRVAYTIFVLLALLATLRYLPRACHWCADDPDNAEYWTHLIVDPLVFGLKQWNPRLLSRMREPSEFPFPLNLLISTDMWQRWAKRWDHVDVNSSAELYRDHLATWRCMTGMSALFIMVLAIIPPP